MLVDGLVDVSFVSIEAVVIVIGVVDKNVDAETAVFVVVVVDVDFFVVLSLLLKLLLLVCVDSIDCLERRRFWSLGTSI